MLGLKKMRFGPFELDADAGELVRDGRRLRLRDKPLKLLVALVERPHQVVSREELHARLWPPAMVVEFDDGLNTAVNKLRKALVDSADAPKYIETVGRRGYRFIGTLIGDDVPIESPPAARAPLASARRGQPARWGRRAALMLGGVLLLGALISIALVRRDQPLVTRFAVAIPPAQSIEAGAYQSVAISPAATHLAYIANGRIYVRARDAATTRPLAGTEDQGPLLGALFSPDGEWIAFYSTRHRELRKIALTGGTPVRVSAAQGYIGGSWGADGTIVFAQADGIFAVSDTGGEPQHLVTVDRARGERAQNPSLLKGPAHLRHLTRRRAIPDGERGRRDQRRSLAGRGSLRSRAQLDPGDQAAREPPLNARGGCR